MQEEDIGFFRTACRDVERIVSLLSLEASHFCPPSEKLSWKKRLSLQCTFCYRFFHLLFIKGFTPVIFTYVPFPIWYAVTLSIYGYRYSVLPLYYRLIGYDKYANWMTPQLGSLQPSRKNMQFLLPKLSLSTRNRLSEQHYGDRRFEKMIHALFQKTTYLSPHSRHDENFLDHLLGVYKILVAWKQPVHVSRGGLFHSVYGTFDYRNGCYDLRDGRQSLQDLIGTGAEELAFLICTSDRLGLFSNLYEAMYGSNAITRYGKVTKAAQDGLNNKDGNPLPPLKGYLTQKGFPLRNHITQKVHVIPPELFAHFMVVFCADFMDQGAQGGACRDLDICLFQFLRFRFFNDILRFVAPFLSTLPPVFQKYMWDKDFLEPTREEVIKLKELWGRIFAKGHLNALKSSTVKSETVTSDKRSLAGMIQTYPYLIEPQLLLAGLMEEKEVYCGFSRRMLADTACNLLEEWGTMACKAASMKDTLAFIQSVLEPASA